MPSNEYMDVINFRERGDSKFAHKIGSAKHGKDGKINVYLDSLPLPDKDGRVSLLISPRQEKGRAATPTARPARDSTLEDDSEVPF